MTTKEFNVDDFRMPYNHPEIMSGNQPEPSTDTIIRQSDIDAGVAAERETFRDSISLVYDSQNDHWEWVFNGMRVPHDEMPPVCNRLIEDGVMIHWMSTIEANPRGWKNFVTAFVKANKQINWGTAISG